MEVSFSDKITPPPPPLLLLLCLLHNLLCRFISTSALLASAPLPIVLTDQSTSVLLAFVPLPTVGASSCYSRCSPPFGCRLCRLNAGIIKVTTNAVMDGASLKVVLGFVASQVTANVIWARCTCSNLLIVVRNVRGREVGGDRARQGGRELVS
eukprot:1556318-Rhodomonas_salina.1